MPCSQGPTSRPRADFLSASSKKRGAGIGFNLAGSRRGRVSPGFSSASGGWTAPGSAPAGGDRYRHGEQRHGWGLPEGSPRGQRAGGGDVAATIGREPLGGLEAASAGIRV